MSIPLPAQPLPSAQRNSHGFSPFCFIHVALPILLVLSIGIFYIATIRQGHVWGDDHAAYIHHAKNIVEGRLYGDTGYMRSPTSVSPKMYPPVFPLLLAPVVLQYGVNLTAMKIECIAFFCTALLILYFLIKDEIPRGWAFATVAIVGLCPYFWDFKDTLYSEYPFLAFTYAALFVARRAEAQAQTPRRRLLLGIIFGVLACLAYGARSVGFLLLPAIIFRQVALYRKMTALVAAAVISFAIGALLQKQLFHLDSDYAAPFAQTFSVRHLLGSPWYYFKCLSVLWDNGYSPLLQSILYGLFTLIASCALWLRFRSAWSPIDAFFAAYVLFIIWFAWGGTRYLMPIMPFYFFYVIFAVTRISPKMTGRGRFLIPAIAVTLIGSCFLAKYTLVDWIMVPRNAQNDEVAEMVHYVRQNTRKDCAVVFEKARFLALYSGVKTVDVYETGNLDAALRFYSGAAVGSLILPRNPVHPRSAFLQEFVAGRPEEVEKVFENRGFTIYKFKALL